MSFYGSPYDYMLLWQVVSCDDISKWSKTRAWSVFHISHEAGTDWMLADVATLQWLVIMNKMLVVLAERLWLGQTEPWRSCATCPGRESGETLGRK